MHATARGRAPHGPHVLTLVCSAGFSVPEYFLYLRVERIVSACSRLPEPLDGLELVVFCTISTRSLQAEIICACLDEHDKLVQPSRSLLSSFLAACELSLRFATAGLARLQRRRKKKSEDESYVRNH